ncbi:mannosyltransferase, Alg9 like-protein [Emiliania huxleyi CCMP1516]|uniref:Mannosyltransferase n=2 Tax=Emiliania huxleyi TaxID=2903 RepID=A0A0D3KZH2_EMIH1|nr:mannosyltransferase, Alg9 like-protein [Emiliania huxleyi CCMP1516]EOD41157.1 mannosyltransferase, Alg9 like-protein [Emiliania huxleyi CCMP1516]|eukprot:XP_005793586.1 mannosyltransferase, Alg9 like-protein [Emiliania huxleyi CCMP1516]
MAARRRRAAAAPPQTPDAKAPRSSSAGHLPRPYRPRLALLLPPLLAVRLYGALASPITDCDEAFNYWEPLHYLLYGRGLQTWEYSPVFGLRSYAYLAMHAAFARLASSVLRSKVSVFLAVRCALGCTSAVLEARLAARTCAWASGEAGVALWALLLSSAGMWHAAVALLPSSFAMLCVLAAWTAWMDASLPALPAGSPPADRSVRKAYGAAIFWVAAGCLLGWPFLCVLAAPLAIDAVVALGLRRFVARALLAGALLAAPSAAVDGYYYGRFVLPWLNLLHFYLRNLCLNLNLALPALLLAPLLLLAGRLEERFLFPAYPLFLLAAALAASEARRVAAALLARCAPRRAQRGREGGPHGVWPPLWGLPAAALAASALLSAGRVGALVSYYGAPLEVYSEVSAALSSRADDSPLRVCSGKEWYRYPSSFFLPLGATPAFYRAGFDGLLPSPFSAPPPDGSRAIHAHFNDGNRDEPAAYTSEDRCDVIVDLELPGDAAPRSRAGWHVWARRPFLDADRSPSWSRALYVPWLTAGRNVYANYSVLGRQPLMVMLHGSV